MKVSEFKVGMTVWSRTLECECYFTEQCQEMMDRAIRESSSIFLEVSDQDNEILEMTASLIDKDPSK